MPILLGIDFETTGLDPKTDKVIEVGMALWDTDHGLIEATSALFCLPNVTLSLEIESLTGISQQMMEEFGTFNPLDESWDVMQDWFELADYTVAHNAPFEQSFLRAWPGMDGLADMNPWIDTMTDIPGHEGKRLSYLAADHGFVNPFPHRALPDVLTMLTVLAKYDFAEIERRATAPQTRLWIQFPYDETRKKNEAVKALGFKWEPNHKAWHRTLPDFLASEVTQKAQEAGFQVFVQELKEAEVLQA